MFKKFLKVYSEYPCFLKSRMVLKTLALMLLKSYSLAVFSECVVAFGASEELSGGLVASTGLNLPNVG